MVVVLGRDDGGVRLSVFCYTIYDDTILKYTCLLSVHISIIEACVTGSVVRLTNLNVVTVVYIVPQSAVLCISTWQCVLQYTSISASLVSVLENRTSKAGIDEE